MTNATDWIATMKRCQALFESIVNDDLVKSAPAATRDEIDRLIPRLPVVLVGGGSRQRRGNGSVNGGLDQFAKQVDGNGRVV